MYWISCNATLQVDFLLLVVAVFKIQKLNKTHHTVDDESDEDFLLRLVKARY